jgi:hypothetical protein
MSYPSSIDTFNIIDTSRYEDEAGYVLHQHLNAHGSATNAIETTLGTNSGTSVLKDFTAGEFAVARNAGGTLTDTITLGTFNNGVLGTPAITGGTYNTGTFGTPTLINPIVTTAYQNGNISGHGTISWAKGDLQTGTLTANGTIDFADAVAGQRLTMFLVQNGTGGYSISFTPTITWQDAVTPTWGTTASKYNAMVIYSPSGTTYLGMGAKFV